MPLTRPGIEPTSACSWRPSSDEEEVIEAVVAPAGVTHAVPAGENQDDEEVIEVMPAEIDQPSA